MDYNNYDKDLEKIKNECKEMMNYHVILKFEDGCMVDGIIQEVDDEYVTILVGEDVYEEEAESTRKRYYGGSRRRYRRYGRRRRFPLRGLGLLLPFVYPYYPY